MGRVFRAHAIRLKRDCRSQDAAEAFAADPDGIAGLRRATPRFAMNL